MKHIDLFSGIGGFALAAHWAGYRTEVFCEQDPFCQQVLRRHWPAVPVVPDIRDFDGSAYRGADLLTGGFPCQPFSTAGKRRGDQDDRFLWPEMLRVISEARPHWCLLENVAGIISMALDDVLSDLENEGYATQAFVLPACAVNAPHKRDRVWIVAHTDRNEHHGAVGGVIAEKNGVSTIHRQENHTSWRISGASSVRVSDSADVAHASQQPHWQCHFKSSQGQVQQSGISDGKKVIAGRFTRKHQPGMGDMAHGLPGRLVGHFDAEPAHISRIATGITQRAAQLKALGNAVVVPLVYEILNAIKPVDSH